MTSALVACVAAGVALVWCAFITRELFVLRRTFVRLFTAARALQRPVNRREARAAAARGASGQR